MIERPGAPDGKYHEIDVEVDGKVARIRLTRPSRHNALSMVMRAEIVECLGLLAEDDTVSVASIVGDGGTFCAGLDRDELYGVGPEQRAAREAITRSSAVFHRAVANFPKPLIAGIDGYALGTGFDLANLCDVRIATSRAVFAHVEVPAGGVAVYTPMVRIVGDTWARTLCLTGRRIDAATAERIGLVTRVVEPEDLLDAVDAEAQLMAAVPLRTLRFTKSFFAGPQHTEEFLLREHDDVFGAITGGLLVRNLEEG